MRRTLAPLFLLLGAAGTGWGQQLSPPGTGGVVALADALRQLGATKRVLVIGAHPDDENTQLLALLSRGMGVQAAYLSLSRGEGGQNLIGAELGPELGVIRSEELLAARALDGAGQYFTRAYDFGFSKSADEALRFWPRDSLLKDVLDVVRRFHPQIIVSIFSGTPRDGHGQHQEAGILAREAFDVLRDSSWGPVKLYRSAFFDTAGTTATLRAGELDPLLGQSYYQLAMAARSRHRSQDMGQLQRPGPNAVPLALVATRQTVGAQGGGDGSLFAGVDTVLHGRERFVALIDSARARLNPWRPGAIVPYLARALRELGADRGDAEQRRILEGALAAAAGVAIDGVADDGIVIGGQRLQVELTVWNAGDSAIRVDSVAVTAPAGWLVERLDPTLSPVAPGAVLTRRFVVTVAADAPRSVPYFLRRPLVGALYDWTGIPPAWRGEPFEPPPLEAQVRLTVAGQTLALSREVAYRYRDQAIGEIRRPLMVTRDFDVAVAPDQIVWPIDSRGKAGSARRFTVSVTSRARGPAAARLAFTVPRGWAPIPPESLSFQREDETKSVTVTLAPPPEIRPGAYQLGVAAQGKGGGGGGGALVVIDYPHIRPRAVEHPSAVAIRAAPIALPAVARVGYVRGASDRVPEALLAVGLPIELLDADSLAHGDLAAYDAIVIGSRAYETDGALAANNGRLLDYARGGGLVIVQYQQYPFVDGGFAPYRLSIARPHDRVTDETAPVTPLDTAHPVFHYPNAIGPDDWREWVQERGLYFAHDWDSTYVPLLETHDGTGPALKGGLLVAPLGRGTYVYTGLSFFRQLPAGVPGAYRLFANLLGLRRTNVP
ncbi:MAG TPA: PIG-L family deacetylase [Gemmatimonadales bacterium]|nr:PIG-L family deacetylase [Gemmatimonadales bacterium]